MEIAGVIALLVVLYLAFKVAGLAFKVFMWALVLAIGYWLIAPRVGLPMPW